MIFSAPMAAAVREGRKTQTRRPVKLGQDRCTYRVGCSYSVQPGRGKAGAVRLVVLEVRTELVGDIVFADARAEGFRTTDAFKAYFVGLHDGAWVASMERLLNALPATEDAVAAELGVSVAIARRRLRQLQRITVAASDGGRQAGVVELDADGVWQRVEAGEHTAVLDRFRARHADRLVWVIRFELDRAHRPRLLAPATRGERDGDEHGYTDNPARALPDEPEAVDEATLAAMTVRARHDDELRRAGVDDRLLGEQRTLEGRLRTVAALARERGIDARNDLRVIERRIDAIERRIRDQRAGARDAA